MSYFGINVGRVDIRNESLMVKKIIRVKKCQIKLTKKSGNYHGNQ